MERERTRINRECENRVALASGCGSMTVYGGAELLTHAVGSPWWPVAMIGIGCASTVGTAMCAAMANTELNPQDTGQAVAVQLPAIMRRNVEHDRMLLRYVRGLHTGNVQSLHGGRLITTRTTPANIPTHILEGIQRRVNPEAVRLENELMSQAASGVGKEDD